MVLGFLINIAKSFNALAAYDPFVVYYGDSAPLQQLDQFKMLVLDSQYHPPLRPLADRGKVLLGYLSLGEVSDKHPYYSKVQSFNILLKENPHWQGSYMVDIRKPEWPKFVLEEMIPNILRMGFEGLFLDTLESPIDLERTSPQNYIGMRQAALELVQAIRLHYPKILIMQNRAYSILEETSPYIDMVLGESVYTTYNFEKKIYEYIPTHRYRRQVRMLKDAITYNPLLQIYTLDYWNPEDKEGIKNIYAAQHQNGFVPYVSTIGLNEIIPPPDVK